MPDNSQKFPGFEEFGRLTPCEILESDVYSEGVNFGGHTFMCCFRNLSNDSNPVQYAETAKSFLEASETLIASATEHVERYLSDLSNGDFESVDVWQQSEMPDTIVIQRRNNEGRRCVCVPGV